MNEHQQKNWIFWLKGIGFYFLVCFAIAGVRACLPSNEVVKKSHLNALYDEINLYKNCKESEDWVHVYDIDREHCEDICSGSDY